MNLDKIVWTRSFKFGPEIALLGCAMCLSYMPAICRNIMSDDHWRNPYFQMLCIKQGWLNKNLICWNTNIDVEYFHARISKSISLWTQGEGKSKEIFHIIFHLLYSTLIMDICMLLTGLRQCFKNTYTHPPISVLRSIGYLCVFCTTITLLNFSMDSENGKREKIVIKEILFYS